MTHKTARRPKAYGDFIRAVAHLSIGVAEAREELRDAVQRATDETFRVLDLATLELSFAELYHSQREVDLAGAFLLKIDRVDAAVAMLAGWARNPYRV